MRGVILFPGSNREGDVASRACRQSPARKPAIVWHAEHELPAGTDLVVLPGGFSYGDYLRCGAIAGARAGHGRGARPCRRAAASCSASATAFRSSARAGFLPGVLMRNRNLRFICRMQHLRVERTDTAFTAHYRAAPGRSRSRSRMAKAITTPTARRSHGSKARAASPSAIATPMGQFGGAANPNGSTNDIAGIYSEKLQRARPDAASGKSDRSARRRHRRTGAVRKPSRRLIAKPFSNPGCR